MQVTRVVVVEINLAKQQEIICQHLTYSASKLWNVANYEVAKNNLKPNKLKSNLKNNFWYKNLHSQSAQAVLEKLQIAWENCYKKHTKRPRFQPKDGHFPVRWKKQGIQVQDGKIRLSLSKQTKEYLKTAHSIESDYLWISLPKNLSLNNVQEVEIKPHTIYGHTTYVMHVVYRKTLQDKTTQGNGVMAVDLGVGNLATVVTTNNTATIYDGKSLVSRLRLFSKKKAKLQSAIDKNKHTTSKKMHYLIIKERNYLKDYTHKVSTFIVRQAIQEEVKTIAIGKLSYGITNMDIGRRNNEKLHKIPFGKLCNMIEYKAKEVSIDVVLINESYTSQTCSTCGRIDKSNRKFRGLYVCDCGNVLNADINGAANILKRVVPSLKAGRDRGFLNNPVRVAINH
ncbi:putative transposase [Carboxydocella thermautotrophica]|nr:putative transposase [Carboxydocella thermautotrophica]